MTCFMCLYYKYDVCPSIRNVGGCGLWSHSATRSGNRHKTG